jgi:hypothetical protein
MFKQLKQKLISENRIGKYLTYALGEIILIVIGILVAVSLGNRNDNQKDAARAKILIKELHSDLRRDTTVFGEEIRKIDQIIHYKRMLLEKDSVSQMDTDLMIGVLTVGYHNIKMNEGTYIKMKESGLVTLDQYEDLLKRINNYYIFNKTYLENRNVWEVGLYERDLNQWVYQDKFEVKMGSIADELQSPELKRKNLIEMLESPQGRNVLKMSLLREKLMQETYQMIFKAANKILVKVDSLSVK